MNLEAFTKERESLADHCGIVAAWGLENFHFFSTGLAGLNVMQTRGYDGAGFAAIDDHGVCVSYKGEGRINDVFSQNIISEYDAANARLWIYQVRYGTNGSFHPENVQPVERRHEASQELFFVAHNGQFAYPAGFPQSDTVRFSKELASASQSTWDERIVATLAQQEGAWSLVIGTSDALYLARDPRGIRPLSYGWRWDNDTKQAVCVVASETRALEKMQIPRYFEVLPGQILRFGDGGLKIVQDASTAVDRSACIFENVYIQDGGTRVHAPRDTSEAIQRAVTVNDMRELCGVILARETPLTRDVVDVVIGVPGTGISGGKSYAETLRLPYAQTIFDREEKDRRTFMQADVPHILSEVMSHFAFDRDALFGKRVCLVDDSLVRGNVMTGLITLLRKQHGVATVHVRILCPPIDKPCHLGINTRNSQELIVARFDGDLTQVQRTIGADSLAYLPAAGLREAVSGNPNVDGFCMGCMVGHRPPIDRLGNVLWQQDTTVRVPAMLG